MTSRFTVFVISLMFILFACAKIKCASIIWTDGTTVATKSCDDEKKCLNGASCKVEDGQELCKCLSGTRGDFCEIVKGCDTVDCGSYDDVHCAFDGKSGGYCKCKDVKKLYDPEKKECRTPCKNECKNYGECEGNEDAKFCKCKPGTRGDLCETVIDCSIYKICGKKKDVECMYDVRIGGAVCLCEDPRKKFFRDSMECTRTCKFSCSNAGLCEDMGDAKFCKCKPGTSGDTCQIITDCTRVGFCGYEKDVKCVYDKKKEGGTCHCEDPKKSFFELYKKCITSCRDSGDCQPFEICTFFSLYGNLCLCQQGKSGERCEIITDCVEGKYRNCKGNNGQCRYNEEILDAECDCGKEKKWDEKNDLCRSPCNDECENYGECEGDDDTKFCKCKLGTRGDYCEVVTDCSIDQFCGNKEDVECVYDVSIGGAICKCEDPDKLFSRELKKCATTCNGNCSNNGICEDNGGAKFCKCKLGFSGDLCETVTDCAKYGFCGYQKDVDCFYDETRGEGTCRCRDPKKSFNQHEKKCAIPCNGANTCPEFYKCKEGFCICMLGRSGEGCKTTDDCETNGKYENCKVENGGNCEYNNDLESAECVCSAGKKWDAVKEKCRASCKEKCNNNGKCERNGDFKFCKCSSGTRGDLCEIVDDCDYNPYFCGSKADVRCVYNESIQGGSCECLDYEKLFDPITKKCRVPCKDDCVNNGECEVVGEVKLCKCTPGTSGDRCEIVNDCVSMDFCGTNTSVKCIYDSIKKGGACKCEDPMKHFDPKSRDCRSVACANFTCQNDGICTEDDFGTAKCYCVMPFSGERCEKGPCTDNPCKNGGTCQVWENKYKCICNNQYFGVKCEMDPCTPNPCQNGGTCLVKGVKFLCSCMEQVSGTTCEIDNRLLSATLLVLTVLVLFIIICGGYFLFQINEKFSQNSER